MGPTASGKTDLAIEIAQKIRGVIFNCDSIQVYRELNIGSAKPTREQMQQVPHYLFDLMSAPQVMTASRFRDAFMQALSTLEPTTPVVVVGGTGFYFLALEKGLFEIPETPESLKKQIASEHQARGGDTAEFWKELQLRDPEHALKIHPHDEYRILRAIEILRNNPSKNLTQLFDEKRNAKPEGWDLLKFYLKIEPSSLESRIRHRTSVLIKKGLLEETKALLDKGLEPWSPLNSVGYFEAKRYWQGQLPLAQIEESIVIATRQLAKKQRTWFQRDPDSHSILLNSDHWAAEMEAKLARFIGDR